MKNEYGNSPWSNSPLQILHKIYLPATLYFVIFGYLLVLVKFHGLTVL